MSILIQSIFAISFGLLSTLPLGPSGVSIVSSFGLNGTKKGFIALSALALAELLYLAIALILRHKGILSLSSYIEILFSIVFGVFLILFGSVTFKQSKAKSSGQSHSFKKVFAMSLLNPSLIISYLGLIILMDKSAQGKADNLTVLILAFLLLSTSWLTLYTLGKIAQYKKNFISHNMHTIKSILGPLFIVVGLSTLVSTF